MALEKKDKRTLPLLTRYERARVIGARAEMLAKGAASLLVVGGRAAVPDARKLAEAELAQGHLEGFIVARPLYPGGAVEYWRIGDLRRVQATGFDGLPLSTSTD